MILIYLSNIKYWKYFITGWTNLAKKENKCSLLIVHCFIISTQFVYYLSIHIYCPVLKLLRLQKKIILYILQYMLCVLYILSKIFLGEDVLDLRYSQMISLYSYLKRVEVFIHFCLRIGCNAIIIEKTTLILNSVSFTIFAYL